MTMTKGEAMGFLEKCRYWFMPYTSEEDTWNEALDMAIEALRDKPKGEWIDSRDTDTPWNDGFKCSACKRDSLIRYNFCPHCGAIMLRWDGEDE